jgi:plastocyanin
MVHCHIENHAANGMMTVIQYEGYKPSGPLAEFWDETPEAGSGQQIPGHTGQENPNAAHSGHGSSEGTPESSQSPVNSPSATAKPVETVTPQPTTTSTGSSDDVTRIAMQDDRFGPKSITVNAGQTVTWVNKGADWHSVASYDGSFSVAQVAPGDTFTHTFETPGIYKYICKHHARQGMIGEIIVTE